MEIWYFQVEMLITFLNEKLLKLNLSIITPKINTLLPALNYSWIAGVTDGEGCFSSSLFSNSSAYRIRYILTQKPPGRGIK